MARGTKVHFYRGHYIYPGRIKNGGDDVLGTWYVVHEDCSTLGLRGRGHSDLASAKLYIDDKIGSSEWKYSRLEGEWLASGLVDDVDYIGSDITIVTRRGEEHRRRVVGVKWKSLERDGKALVCVKLADDLEIVNRAQMRYFSAKLERLENDLKECSRYLERTFDIAHSQFEEHEIRLLESDLIQLVASLESALEDYQTATVPKKHPLPKWMSNQT